MAVAEPVLVGARLTSAERARRRSLFLLLGASTTVWSRGVRVGRRWQQQWARGEWRRRRWDKQLTKTARTQERERARERQRGVLPHTWVFVTLCTVVMAPWTIPSFSWMILTTGARQLVVHEAAVTMWSAAAS